MNNKKAKSPKSKRKKQATGSIKKKRKHASDAFSWENDPYFKLVDGMIFEHPRNLIR